MNITLYRKYRPQNFMEIAGQEPITRAIKNSLREFAGDSLSSILGDSVGKLFKGGN